MRQWRGQQQRGGEGDEGGLLVKEGSFFVAATAAAAAAAVAAAKAVAVCCRSRRAVAAVAAAGGDTLFSFPALLLPLRCREQEPRGQGPQSRGVRGHGRDLSAQYLDCLGGVAAAEGLVEGFRFLRGKKSEGQDFFSRSLSPDPERQ